MDIQLLLSHPKQYSRRREDCIRYHKPMYKREDHYQVSKYTGLNILAEAVNGRALSEATSSDDTLSTSSGREVLQELDDYVKPKRKRASAIQLEMLKNTFLKTPFPTSEYRKFLAKKLGMTPRSVQIWFQNQRQMARNSIPQKDANV